MKTFATQFLILLTITLTSNLAQASAPPVQSIYPALTMSWNSDSGKKTTFTEYKGRKLVASMIYTSCQSACPLIIKKLEAVQKRLTEQNIDTQFAIVSFDTAGDTPEKLTHFRHHMKISHTNWNFLVGSELDTRKLSMLLGIKYSKNAKSGEIMHDNKILLLNEKGEIVRTLDGLEPKFDELY